MVRTNDRYVLRNCDHYARFMFSSAETHRSVMSWHDTLRVVGVIEIAPQSWLTNADRIGSSVRLGSIAAEVEFNLSLEHDSPSMQDALWFACKELNPMLESMTTLKGIEHNIDIIVEHGLRPTNQLLQNLVYPRKHIEIRRKS